MKSEFFCCFCNLLLFCWEQLQCHLQSVISMEQKMGAMHHPLNFHPLLQGAHLEPKILLWVLSSLTVLFWEMARCCWETSAFLQPWLCWEPTKSFPSAEPCKKALSPTAWSKQEMGPEVKGCRNLPLAAYMGIQCCSLFICCVRLMIHYLFFS